MPRSRHDPKALEAVANTRERLIVAACEEFLTLSFLQTDSNAIARRAGLSTGTFYNHFDSKEAIFVSAFERLASEETNAISQACLERFNQTEGSLAAVAEVFVDTLVKSRQRLSVIRQQAEILLRIVPEVQACKRRVRDLSIAALVNHAQLAGITLVSLEELHVRMHIINALGDALATSEFEQYGVGNQCARQQLIAQLTACINVK